MTGATRSTGRSSRESDHANTGQTGPRTSLPSPNGRSHESQHSSMTRTRLRCGLSLRSFSRDYAAISVDGITAKAAIEMLAQHLITRPVFNALFDGDELLDNNPVAQTMERMLAALGQHDLEAGNESLHKFYDSV